MIKDIDYRTISLLNAEQAHAFRVVPSFQEGNSVSCWGEYASSKFLPQLQLLLGKSVTITPLENEELERLLYQYYPVQHTKASAFTYGMKEESDTVRYVNKVMEEAVHMGVSDIHIERYEEQARIRFRWEGQLIEKYEIPLDRYNAIVSRIKILSELDIAERRLPQDGRINLSVNQNSIDVRVSTIPSKYGEMVVMRLLTRSQEHLDIHKIGLPEKEKAWYLDYIQSPNGIILITGPTGSGKTTTLYATLNLLNDPDKKILTIEDPIEYNLAGINQVQLKEDIGLTFDAALRAFLRHDPNIIMVGEIRDMATAQVAMRAALTGHLVFSTLHTNSAWDAVSRLTDMGIEPYLIAASLRMVVAQRLVRTLCPHCKVPSEELLLPDIQQELDLFHHYVPFGCPTCYFTGYKGRIPVFEFLPITPELKNMIKSREGEIDTYLSQTGIPTFKDHLCDLIREGSVSLEEGLVYLR
ncbi:MAG: GspE/PulE family protein [Bacteroidota bacterium]